MPKEKPKKEDYVECPECRSFLRKDKLEKSFWDDDPECPVCGTQLVSEKKEGKEGDKE